MKWGWLKAVGRGAKHAAPIALLFVPAPFQGVANVIYNGVRNAEIKGGTGPEKLSHAMQYASWMLPTIAKEIQKITGRRVVNEQALEAAMSHLAQFFVQIEKAVGGKPG